MSKIFKTGEMMKRVLALALAFVLVLGYIPVGVSAEEATKTVYVGVIEWITDYVPEIHYWNNGGLAADVALTATGKTVSAYAGDGYWSDNQTFRVYTAEVPAAATNMKTWDQDTDSYWAAEDEICQSNKMLLLFEWGGIHHNTTIDCPHPVHGTDGNCSACGTAVDHSYDSTGLCGCGLQAEAQVGSEFMSYLDAVQNVTGSGTIKLLTDVTADSVNGNNGHYLDLNGKTLTVSELWAPSTSFLCIQDSTTTQEGKIVGDVYTSQYLYLEGGTIEGTVWLTSYSQLNGSFTMTGGAIKADTDLYINTDGAAVELQGGEFIDGLKIVNNASVTTPMTLADTLYAGYRFYQNGSVVDMTGVTDTISGSTVKVQSHTHAYSSTTGFCPCGDECAHSSKTNGTCDTCGMADAHTHEYVNGACSCGKTAQVLVTYSDSTTKYFDTLQAALDTFSKNNSFAYVKLLTNIAVGDNVSADIYTHYTLDLNGYCLTASELVVPASGGMEIMDTSVGQTGQINALVRAHGPLTIWSGTFNDTVLVTTMSNVKGSVTVRDGKFTAATDFQIADDGCSLSLWSGTFPGGIKVEAINGATKDELAGFLYNNNSYFQNCEKVTLTAGQSEISGGHVVVAYDAKHQFGSNTKCSYCGLDAIVSMSLDGVTTYYGTVYDLRQDLVQENAGCTIQLLADITTTYFSDKDGRCGFYLDLNGHTLTASDGVSLPSSSGCTIMDTSDEGDGKIVGNVYAAYSTALQSGTIAGTVSFPQKASYTGYTFWVEGGTIDAAMDFGINDNNTSITITGGTFPGGISVACGENVTTPVTLADCISGNYKYFKNGSVVALTEGQTEITGGDVTVAVYAGHTHTYSANGFCEGILPDTYAVCGSYEMPEGAGTEASPYIIDNAGKLFWFAAVVNGGYEDTNGNSAAWAKVTEDITIPEGMTWTPISGYRGTFDGGKRTISGMHVASDAYYVGMFSKTGTCTIQDLSITDSSFETTNNRGYAGAIAGYCGDGTSEMATITGCHVGDVTVSGWTAGGITGCLYNYSEVKNCTTSDGLVVNAVQEGGAVAGRCQSGSYIEWVSAYGTVTGYYAGGIVGYVFNDAGPYVTRSNEVVMSTYVGDVGTSSTLYAGGIIGYVSDSSKATINNCSVKCNVTAEYSVNSRTCGLLGHSNNGSNSMVSVSNSFTIDTTLSPQNISKASLASGGATVTNCYSDDQENLLTLPSVNEVNCAKKTDEQFESGEVAYLLDAPQSTHAWGQNIDNGNLNYGMPVRNQHKVYQVILDCAGTVGYSNTESTGAVAHNYVNGFCEQTAGQTHYEPAVKVTNENFASLGLSADYVGYYAIGNAGQLYWFADKVDNENAVYSSANVVLTDNITVNEGTVTAESTGLRAWNPIGYYSVEYIEGTGSVYDDRSFEGIFDGNNKTVSGLYLNDPEAEYVGLIARADQGFQVKNVTLSNSYLKGSICVGGIVAYGSDGTITGCVNNATIYGSGTDNEAGGVVGTIYTSTITDCINNGTVCNDTSVAGGVACEQYSANMERCVNTGAVHGAARAGGVVGYSAGTIRDCENSGTITSDGTAGGIIGGFGTAENCGNSGTVTGREAGGIFAYDGNAVNCWNTGTIHGTSYAGGIEGYNDFPWTPRTIENCWSTGAVTCDENGIAGGILAYSKCGGQTVKNSYSVMEPVGQIDEEYAVATVTNVESKTIDQFESGEVAYLLRTRAAEGTNVWGQDLDNGKTVQTVPTFDGADVYQISVGCAGDLGYSNTDADKVSHVPTHVPAAAATCTEEGNIEHWVCVCGKFFAEEACTTELSAEDISIQPTGHTYGTEGTCININNGVVCGHGAGASLTTKTGGTKFFDTLQEALDAAKTTVAADEAVVKVLKDVVNTDKISAVKAKGGVFTLDVGDAKLVGDDYGLSVENATVTITGNTGYIDCIYGLYSDLVIDGVTVKAQQSSSTAINMQYCNLAVKSGSVINNKYAGYAILGYGEDYEIVIEGGTITATGNTGKGIALMGGTTVSVTGGTINAVEDLITMDGLCSLSGVLAGGSFPGGLYVKEDQKDPDPNHALADGFAYWQQDVQIDVADDAQTIQGDVEVKSDCKHPSITYSASGYALTADCDTCSAASTLELIPQTDEEKIYSGTEKSAAYTGSILGLDTVPLAYEGDRVNVGSFTASVTVGGATVEMSMQILPYELEIKTFTLADKVYDGTNTCAVTSLSFVSTANGEELVLGTDFTAQLTFPAADAGEYDDAVLTVELKDTALASNYILKSDTVTGISHSITPATITVTDVKVEDKVYDGTTDATVTEVTISGIVAGDDVKVEAQAAFADKNSGEGKTVNLTYTLAGNDAGNYVLADDTGTATGKVTAKPLPEIMEPVKDLSVDNVTSDDKQTLEDVKEELEFVLTDEGLTDEQRKEREDALQDVQDMLDRIQDAADAITTDPIMDTKDITADNITLDDREDVEQALEDLYGALEDYENNYTDAQKEGIHDDIERLEAALAALKQVEDLIKDIEALPNEVQPDTPYRDDILDAKDRYDGLDDHQKDLVPEEILQKLNDLLADLKVYLIIKGDGQTWTDGDLSFTANGPFALFMELKIDGNTVAASNYTAVSGSTVLTLKESYVETLTAGKHSIKFVYPDGEAVGSFTVEIPTNGSATTGDETPIMLLVVMMSVSLAGAAMLLERKRKV